MRVLIVAFGIGAALTGLRLLYRAEEYVVTPSPADQAREHDEETECAAAKYCEDDMFGIAAMFCGSCCGRVQIVLSYDGVEVLSCRDGIPLVLGYCGRVPCVL